MLFSVVSTWGGNKTSIDILISQPNLSKVQRKLTENLIDYKIILEDLQKAIDEENPLKYSDEQAGLRQGLLISKFVQF